MRSASARRDPGVPVTRAAILAALFFSGLTALVYQILWTRQLGFAFGTSTSAWTARCTRCC